VSCAGSLCTKPASSFLPQTSRSSNSSPAARTRIRAIRLLTLGVRMLSVFAATEQPSPVSYGVTMSIVLSANAESSSPSLILNATVRKADWLSPKWRNLIERSAVS
jgi:hypothetical protein